MTEQLKTREAELDKESLVNALGFKATIVREREHSIDGLQNGDFNRLHKNVHKSDYSEPFYFTNGESLVLGHSIQKNDPDYNEQITLRIGHVIDPKRPRHTDTKDSLITINVARDGGLTLASIQKRMVGTERMPSKFVDVQNEEEQMMILKEAFGKIRAVEGHLKIGLPDDDLEIEDGDNTGEFIHESRRHRFARKFKDFFIEEASSFKNDHHRYN